MAELQGVPTLLVALTLLFLSGTTLAMYPFQDPSLPWEERVDDVVGRLTLPELQEQLARGGVGVYGGPAPAIPRLGIPPYQWNTECLRGDVFAGNATSFPQAIGLAAARSPSLLYRVAEAIGMEVRAKHNNYTQHKYYGDFSGISCFSPVINIMRDPRWGRNQETYGEDPIMTGILAAHYVQGLQGNDPRYVRANAGCKHFDAHGGPEDIPVSRFSFNAVVSEQDWRMTFLPAFRACVNAGTLSVMCSYNRLNGIPSCANKELLTDILRKEWGFKGYVISDQGAIENIITQHHYFNNSVDTVAACINAGCNIEISPNKQFPVYSSLLDAVNAGKLTEDVVREAAKPLFYTRMRLGEFDPPTTNPYSGLDLSLIQSPRHQALSLEAAMKTFVLLKNEDGFLPLLKQPASVAIVGPMANNPLQLFGDYTAQMDPKFTVTPLQGLSKIGTSSTYGAGCTDNNCTSYNPNEIKEAVSKAEVVFVCLGTGQELEAEMIDRADMDLPPNQVQLLNDAMTYSKGAPVVLLVFSAGPVNLTQVDPIPQVKAILQCFFPAETAGQALFNVLTGSGPGSSPAGRLPYTWYKYASQVPPMTDYSMTAGRTYRYLKTDPLYPFGYGLSYNKFNYVSMEFPSQVAAGQDLQGTVTLVNRGPLPGDEVYQVYIAWNHTVSVPVPRLQLAAFDRVTLPVNSPQAFRFTVPAETMAVWVEGKGWMLEEGRMVLYVGGQQPNQERQVPSNVLMGYFTIQGSKYLGRF